MPTRLSRARKNQERCASLSAHLSSKMCSAEDAGLIPEAEAFELVIETARTAWFRSGSEIKNHLCHYLGAPEASVDLEKKLTSPAYLRHLNLPHLSATPPPLRHYTEARNNRVRKFEEWRPRGNHPDALVQTVAHLVRDYPASGKGANRALNQAMVARRNEIQALNLAIERCYVMGLRTTRSTPEFGQGLLSDLNIIPWQLGHVYLLRDIAINDIETTVEQLEKLRKVIKFLRAQQL